MKLDPDLTALHIGSERLAGCESNGVDDPQLAAPLEEYLAALQTGDRPDREKFLAQYPGLADKLTPLLDGLEFVHQVAPQLRSGDTYSSAEHESKSTAPASLGDYRIIREVGRGGMGVVYEAEQISLSRRVALKVLPFAAVMDPRRLARFRNEAQAAATLTHQYIVPVYAVGSAQGVHYYAMQFIEGCTLADMIEQLRQAAGKTTDKSPASQSLAVKQLAAGLTNGIVAVRSAGNLPLAMPPRPLPAPSAETARSVQAAISTENSYASTHYVRTVTELALQIAEALDYAHRQGVVHRDIKPGNLLLDMQGNPWITDFGLARIENDTNLTMTGDLVGTLRYMSPEQALAQRVIVDHRTDIYSFGVTFYELLTLEPVFAASGRQELLRDIAFREPSPMRKHQRGIPADLETIVMKAMAKNPAERYATAQEMAEDLRRQLADQPIRARRPSILWRVRKWSRRHRAVVASAGAVSVCALLLGAGLLWRERSLTFVALEQARAEREVAKQQREVAQRERESAQHEREVARANFQQAQRAVDDYFTTVSESKLLDVSNLAPLRKELLESAVRYYQGFVAEHGDDPALKAELAAAHIRMAQVYAGEGSDKWVGEMAKIVDIVEPLVAEGVDLSGWKSLREGIVLKAYSDGNIDVGQDPQKFIAISRRAITTWQKLVDAQPGIPGFAHDLAAFHILHGNFIIDRGITSLYPSGRASLQKAIGIYEQLSRDAGEPAKFAWQIGTSYMYLAALECRQQNYKTAQSLAVQSIQVLETPGAPSRFASHIQWGLFAARSHLAKASVALGHREEAIEAWRAIAAMEPSDPSNKNKADKLRVRATAHLELQELDQALADYTMAINLDPNDAGIYRKRAELYLRQGQYQEALADCNKGIELGADADLFELRAQVLEKQGNTKKP
jgi:serine/threonine protein kinase/tetratricopeptide (TPR) repeat protein